MIGWNGKITAWAAATLAGAATFVLIGMADYWIMTGAVLPSIKNALILSSAALISSTLFTVILLTLMAGASRFCRLGRWRIVLSTGAICTALLLTMQASPRAYPYLATALVPALILGGAYARPHAFSRIGRIMLSTALLLWSGWLVIVANGERLRTAAAQASAGSSPLGSYIQGGVVFGSEVWLINGRGKTVSFRLTDWRPRLRASSGVAALATGGQALWALQAGPVDWTVDEQPAARFRLARYARGRWRYSTWQPYGKGERPIALAVGRAGPVVVGPRRIYRLALHGQFMTRDLTTAFTLNADHVAAMIGSDFLYVGTGAGEWGGGLRRITVSSGVVTPIQQIDDGRLCSGLLNSECDPVTGLIVDPDHPTCVFASVGLSHGFDQGHVLRICGQRVELILQREAHPISERIHRLLTPSSRNLPLSTEPFYALAAAPGGFWAATPSALYRWNRGQWDRHALPDLKKKHGMSVSTAISGLVVLTPIPEHPDENPYPQVYAAMTGAP